MFATSPGLRALGAQRFIADLRPWASLCLGLWLLGLAGCTTTPLPEADGGQRVVTRTSNATVWATPEAAQAAAAPTAAPARPAQARAVAPAAPQGQATPASAAAAPAAPAPAVSPAAATAALPAAAAALAQTLYFDFDRFDVKDEFRPVLEGHAQVLMADRSLRLVIEGHADERGGAEYNLALGQKRAQAVVKALVLLGAADLQLEAVSFGDTRPVVPDSSEAAWARNRRAEVKRQ